jgi:hypothetical protein
MNTKLLSLLAILYGLTSSWSKGEMRIRVADYNIKFLSAAALNAKPERKERLQAVIEELKRQHR